MCTLMKVSIDFTLLVKPRNNFFFGTYAPLSAVVQIYFCKEKSISQVIIYRNELEQFYLELLKLIFFLKT